MDKNKIKRARKRAEDGIYSIMNDLDKTGYNANEYKLMFKTMTDRDFYSLMEKIYSEDDYNLPMSIDTFGKDGTPELSDMIDIAKKRNIALTEHVIFPHRNPGGPPMITKDPVPILYIVVRRLQQILFRENDVSGSDSHRNALTNQVVDHDKSASLSDTQTYALTTVGALNCITEFLSARGDDSVANEQMITQIEKNGEVYLKDLDIRTENKTSVMTTEAFLRGAGLDVTFKRRTSNVSE